MSTGKEHAGPHSMPFSQASEAGTRGLCVDHGGYACTARARPFDCVSTCSFRVRDVRHDILKHVLRRR